MSAVSFVGACRVREAIEDCRGEIDVIGSFTKRATGRLLLLAAGWTIGFLWGSVLWAGLIRQGGVAGWLYAAVTCAMLGFGISAVYGAASAMRDGQRVGPRLGWRGRRRRV